MLDPTMRDMGKDAKIPARDERRITRISVENTKNAISAMNIQVANPVVSARHFNLSKRKIAIKNGIRISRNSKLISIRKTYLICS